MQNRARGAALIGIPLFLIAINMPNYFHLGTTRIAPYLIFILAAFVPLMLAWLIGGLGRLKLADVLILSCCIWQAIAMSIVQGFSESVQAIGLFTLQTFGAYLLGRACVRGVGDMRFLATLLAITSIALLPFAVIETRTSRTFFLELFRALGPVYDTVDMDPRWGLDRVQGSFEHPILFGVFIALGFSLVFFRYRSVLGRLATLPAIVLNAIFSLSTGALLALVVQFGLIAWSKVFSQEAKRWRYLTYLVIVMYVLIDLASNRTPFHVFVDYLTFNSGSAYNRILIWQFGSAEMWRHPFFGIAFGEWERPWWMSPSMDNYWLVVAVRYGIPAFLLQLAGFVLILWTAGRRRIADEETVLLRRGMIMGLVAVFVAICSVHLWNATYSWFMFMIGGTVWLMDAGRPALKKGETEASEDVESAEAAAKERPKRRTVIGDLAVAERRE